MKSPAPNTRPASQKSKRKMNQLRATPNQLTLLRLCLIPFLVIAILDAHYQAAFLIFLAAGISDALDGLIARHLHQRTTLGQYLDPIADKLLLSTLFLVLHHVDLVPRWITILVFARDFGILIVGSLLFAVANLRRFRPSIFGKANTLSQIVALTAVLFNQWQHSTLGDHLRWWALLSTAVFTCLSGFDYALRTAWHLGTSPTEDTQTA